MLEEQDVGIPDSQGFDFYTLDKVVSKQEHRIDNTIPILLFLDFHGLQGGGLTFLDVLGLRYAALDGRLVALGGFADEGLVQPGAEVVVPEGILAAEVEELWWTCQGRRGAEEGGGRGGDLCRWR